MGRDNVVAFEKRENISSSRTVLEEIVKNGAQRLLQAAIEAEVNEFVSQYKTSIDDQKHRLVVRNGYLPERDIGTGVGQITVKQPRVRDRSSTIKFTSKILPPFLRRLPSIDALIPTLYLKGISTSDFSEALVSILGPQAVGLSPANIVRLKQGWEAEYNEWSTRNLSNKRYVYWWADGIYFNVRLDPARPCVLVIMGALEDGTKEIISIWDGERESKETWSSIMRSLKKRGLKHAPQLAIGDGALGFWAALAEEYPGAKWQRCWVHKTANILDKLPKSVQVDAKSLIHEMYMAPTRATALLAYEEFKKQYSVKYPRAVECLVKDEDVLFTFYDFPAEHWPHIRTTNPIESTFATIRHRTRQTKGCGSRMATLTMVFKLGMAAEKRWRRLRGSELIGKVIEGIKFVDGEFLKLAA